MASLGLLLASSTRETGSKGSSENGGLNFGCGMLVPTAPSLNGQSIKGAPQ
jgi:hypothetical protein